MLTFDTSITILQKQVLAYVFSKRLKYPQEVIADLFRQNPSSISKAIKEVSAMDPGEVENLITELQPHTDTLYQQTLKVYGASKFGVINHRFKRI